VLAFMQARLGPMRVGPWGLMQAIADPIKLMLKEDIVPAQADKTVFLIAPVIGLIAAFTAFSVIPFTEHFFITDLNVGILFALERLRAAGRFFRLPGSRDCGDQSQPF